MLSGKQCFDTNRHHRALLLYVSTLVRGGRLCAF